MAKFDGIEARADDEQSIHHKNSPRAVLLRGCTYCALWLCSLALDRGRSEDAIMHREAHAAHHNRSFVAAQLRLRDRSRRYRILGRQDENGDHKSRGSHEDLGYRRLATIVSKP